MSILNNAALFIAHLSVDSHHAQWAHVIQELELLFVSIEPFLVKSYDYTCIFVIMSKLLKLPIIAANKVCFKMREKNSSKFSHLFIILLL